MVTKADLIVQHFNVKANYLKWCHSTYYNPNQQHKLAATHVCKKLKHKSVYKYFIFDVYRTNKEVYQNHLSLLVLIKTGSWRNRCTSLYTYYVFSFKKSHLINWWKKGGCHKYYSNIWTFISSQNRMKQCVPYKTSIFTNTSKLYYCIGARFLERGLEAIPCLIISVT